jgi:hypothetical protein
MSASSQAEIPAVPQDHDQVLDAQVVEAPVSLAVARRERRSEVIRPLDVDQLVDSFEAYQSMLPRLLTDTDYQQAGDKRFVKKSGWLKIAAAFDLETELAAPVLIKRDEDGKPVSAAVWIRAIAPSGRSMVGDGYCSIDESRFSSSSGRQKLEHDLPSTAATRARNRAISNLVGMGEVSAEEVDARGNTGGGDSEHPYGPELKDWASNGKNKDVKGALAQLVGPDAAQAWVAVIAQCGYMPQAVADAFRLAVEFLPSEEAIAV